MVPCATVESAFGGSPGNNGRFGVGKGVSLVVVEGGRGGSCGAGDETLKGIIDRKVWLAEGVFAVTLFEYTLIFHGNRREKA